MIEGLHMHNLAKTQRLEDTNRHQHISDIDDKTVKGNRMN